MGNSFSNPPPVPIGLIECDVDMIEFNYLRDTRIKNLEEKMKSLEIKVENIRNRCDDFDYISTDLSNKVEDLYIISKKNKRQILISRKDCNDSDNKYLHTTKNLEEKMECILNKFLNVNDIINNVEIIDNIDTINTVNTENEYKKIWENINENSVEWDTYMGETSTISLHNDQLQ